MNFSISDEAENRLKNLPEEISCHLYYKLKQLDTNLDSIFILKEIGFKILKNDLSEIEVKIKKYIFKIHSIKITSKGKTFLCVKDIFFIFKK